MYKALAVLRTVYLLFIVGYTVWATPFLPAMTRTFDEQYARCSATLHLLVRAAWLAIAWIAFETVMGWILVTRSRRAAPPATPTAPSAPPPAR